MMHDNFRNLNFTLQNAATQHKTLGRASIPKLHGQYEKPTLLRAQYTCTVGSTDENQSQI
jgi:hypothetical protein